MLTYKQVLRSGLIKEAARAQLLQKAWQAALNRISRMGILSRSASILDAKRIHKALLSLPQFQSVPHLHLSRTFKPVQNLDSQKAFTILQRLKQTQPARANYLQQLLQSANQKRAQLWDSSIPL